MKQDFLNFLKALMEHDPTFTAEHLTDSVQEYIKALEDNVASKPEITEKGKIILAYMQKKSGKTFKSRDMSEDLFIPSRSIGGTMRKLVADGFCEKIGKDPIIYALTEKGKNYVID